MALNQDKDSTLMILIELPGGKLQFDERNTDHCLVAMFNPNRLTISRSAQWKSQDAAKRDNPELQFTSAEPSTLSVELLFDTFDTPEQKKRSVRDHTDKLLHLTTIEQHGDKHRPPVCQLKWGRVGVFFQGVLQQMEQQITLFMKDGTPVRSTVKCTFKQWETNQKDSVKQNKKSADVSKTWVVKRGDSLASIAAHEYGDPRKWRPIASANGLDDPLDLRPGSTLVLPALRVS
jgi:nucleoid-associated protein YgaU